MAPAKRAIKAKAAKPADKNGTPPPPFKRPPEVLGPVIQGLSEKHVYVTHVDAMPVDFKRKIFLVPVVMNLAIVAVFVWRAYSVLPWYWKLVEASFGYANETTIVTQELPWSDLSWEVGTRGLSMFADFTLLFFFMPWPVRFFAGQAHGNPAKWRWRVGFRDKEIYVRRSRDWDRTIGDIFKDADSMKILMAYMEAATAPLIQEQKTGYLLMNAEWDLEWDAMIHAHSMVDKKDIALDAFRNIVLIHHQDYGWLVYGVKEGVAVQEDERRRQVFAFRDALTAMGQEDLFYRWVEVVQFEASQPGGFGPEKQADVARQIRELFEAQNIDFEQLWRDVVGTDAPSGM